LSLNVLKVNIYLHFYLYGEKSVSFENKNSTTNKNQKPNIIRIAKLSLNRNNHPYSTPAKLWPFLAVFSRVETEMYSLLSL